jgi:hypothetical protein
MAAVVDQTAVVVVGTTAGRQAEALWGRPAVSYVEARPVDSYPAPLP